ncbi:MAG TPA: helix-turn-helix domain-containing protein [Polyangiaceae bacterium]|jgi:AraC-like DNA-binding protein
MKAPLDEQGTIGRGSLAPAPPGEFLRDPLGRYVRSETGYLIWCRDPSLCGAAYWNSPEVSPLLLELLALDRHPRMVRPFDVLTDTRRVSDLHDGAFRTLASYIRQRLPELSQAIRRHAIVRAGGDGVVDNAIVGLSTYLEPHYVYRAFTSLHEALGWLGRPPELAEELELLTAHAMAGDRNLVGGLRALLSLDRSVPCRAEAARRLGVSERTLRRALFEARLSYRGEVDRVRVEWAKGELLAAPHKIEALARDSGYGAKSQFLRAFQRVTGESPREFRARHCRRGEGPKRCANGPKRHLRPC